jgi:hypothetical protein
VHDLPKHYKVYECRSKPLLQINRNKVCHMVGYPCTLSQKVSWLLLLVVEIKLFCRAVNVLFENNFNLSHHELKTLFACSGSVKLSLLDLELSTSSSLCL